MGPSGPSETERTVVVVLGGRVPTPPPPAVLGPLRGALTIGADLGTAHALGLGLDVVLAVGDFDSLPAADLDRARAGGAEVHTHPAEKDATDLELALHAAAERRPRRVVVLGSAGGRFDHVLGVAFGLATPVLAGARVEAWLDGAHVVVLRPSDPVALPGPEGGLVSLLPVGGPAVGVTTTGLRYPLHDEDLGPFTSRGISNVAIDPEPTVRLRDGVLLGVRPAAEADPPHPSPLPPREDTP